ncbi:NADPH oxidase organizer 1-like [Acanthopagrus latus]|uniref:NADPH oxidase organizer 1-like n=1 Tax=Acanthopagrus latus TaxID=8177 RepID=UPI00187C7E73|nr:NADPH oxidase organizer 1-like [Acanthopagrus latus]XP_036944884.1 NADPH oxidase organizer 1-like [Acanthopagrus latus]
MEAQRYPLSVRLIGVLHKEKSKMYMTSVLWSDQDDIVIYRTFQDFKKMHRQLKKAFPPANKMKKSDRVIPRFRDKKMKRSAQRKGPNKSLMRLKFLQKYCNELLSCDPQVSQSADLIQFFHPKDQDLQPEFAKKGIMIMPSEDEIGSAAGQGGGNVTQPFVTETYRVVAPYETRDTKNKPFKVVMDDKVDVLIKDKAGWWLVENDDKRMAWFPAPYLEKLDEDEDDSGDDTDVTPDRGMLYTAVKSYKATKSDEISVTIGAVVELLQKSENGWWLIRYKGKTGYIPTMYLQPYNYPHIRMTTSSLDPRAPSPNLEQQSQQFSHSHGNMLQLPPARSSSPRQLQPDTKQKSRSLNILPEQAPAQPAARTVAYVADVTNSPTSPQSLTPPTIMVEMDGNDDERGRNLTQSSEGSFDSDSSEFSFSDDLSSSSASSILNLSASATEEPLRLCRTPEPMSSNRLSPTSGQERKMIPSVSDPNLYKGPRTPKVPPRPRAQEILTRCTTITRKNAARGSPSPTQSEILSR